MNPLLFKSVSKKPSFVCQRTLSTSFSARGGAHEQHDGHKNEKEISQKDLEELGEVWNSVVNGVVKKQKQPNPWEGDEYPSYGAAKYEALYRDKLKRLSVFREDFVTMEENHILYGEMGTPNKPVLIESNMTARTVGCQGSSQTRNHSIIWHMVKREKPCICIECGQVFQLVSPSEGEQILPWVDAHH